jgi:hypothetical protein
MPCPSKASRHSKHLATRRRAIPHSKRQDTHLNKGTLRSRVTPHSKRQAIRPSKVTHPNQGTPHCRLRAIPLSLDTLRNRHKVDIPPLKILALLKCNTITATTIRVMWR